MFYHTVGVCYENNKTAILFPLEQSQDDSDSPPHVQLFIYFRGWFTIDAYNNIHIHWTSSFPCGFSFRLVLFNKMCVLGFKSTLHQSCTHITHIYHIYVYIHILFTHITYFVFIFLFYSSYFVSRFIFCIFCCT